MGLQIYPQTGYDFLYPNEKMQHAKDYDYGDLLLLNILYNWQFLVNFVQICSS